MSKMEGTLHEHDEGYAEWLRTQITIDDLPGSTIFWADQDSIVINGVVLKDRYGIVCSGEYMDDNGICQDADCREHYPKPPASTKLAALFTAIADVDMKATRYGDKEKVTAYVIPAGAWHQVLGKVVSIKSAAALDANDAPKHAHAHYSGCIHDPDQIESPEPCEGCDAPLDYSVAELEADAPTTDSGDNTNPKHQLT